MAGTGYAGNQKNVGDQAGKTNRYTYDGLGRLAAVVEDIGGLQYGTNYFYDGAFVFLQCAGVAGVVEPAGEWNGEVRVRQGGQCSFETGQPWNYDIVFVRRAEPAAAAEFQRRHAGEELRVRWRGGGEWHWAVDQRHECHASENYTGFDSLGHVTGSTEVTAGQTYSFAYAYNAAGELASVLARGPEAILDQSSVRQTTWLGQRIHYRRASEIL